MPLQNRVTPEGDIVAAPHRGTVMGNRGGAFHQPDRTLGRARWASRQWICCVLSFKGRRRQVMQPNRYTELFFLDEATALAAGHRPCFECRRAEAMQFAQLWAASQGMPARPSAPEMDLVLHGERLDRQGRKRTFESDIGALPDGAFVHLDAADAPYLIGKNALFPYAGACYGAPVPRPGTGIVRVLTPATIVAVLSAGYRPRLHASAVSAAT